MQFLFLINRNLLILSTLILSLASCNGEIDFSDEKKYRQLTGFTMGTTYQITFESTQQEQKLLQQKVDARLIEINQLMSTYINNSELSLFNQNISDACISMSAENLFVIQKAIEVSQQTQGKFDVTLDPLIKEWGFDTKQTNEYIPDNKTIAKLLVEIGYTKLKIQKNCIYKQSKSVSINLSAIAKGYGVDQIANLIENQGVQNYLVEVGGETASKGLNPRLKNWLLAIEAPVEETRQIQKKFEPLGFGVATSGSYRNYFEKDGKRYSHTIDPTTGKPITHNLVSVTVLHQQTMVADAYATAFMVMGETAALQFAEKNNLAIYMLMKTKNGFVERYSSNFSKHTQLENRE